MSHDANGNVTAYSGKVLTWSSFNKPTEIQANGTTVTFTYGADRSRYRRHEVMPDGTTKTTRYLGKAYERTLTVAPGGSTTTEDRYFIHAAGRLVAVHTENRTDNQARNRFLHRDALGTVTLITDALGQVVERYAFRPFGERAVIEPPGDAPGWTIPAGVTPRLKRGFTGHEHIEGVGLIHMNGRVYDPRLGRFLSADPNVQFIDQPRSYNRYVYAQNNPLKYTDPSGHFITAIAAIALTAGLKAVGLHIAAAAFIATTVVSLAAGADVETALKNGVFAAASAWAAQGIIQGGLDLAPAARTIANGIAQGAISEAAGGEFRSGFVGSVAGTSLGSVDIGLSGDAQVIQATIAGGTASKLSGGRFANGAVSGAFAFMLGRASQARKKGEWIFPEGGSTDINDYDTVMTNGILGDRDQFVLAVNAEQIPGYFNPSSGALGDIFESFGQKFFGWAEDSLAAGFSQGLAGVDHPMRIIAHSQGTLTVANAARYYGLPQGSTLIMRSPAISRWRANAAANAIGGSMQYVQPYGDIANIYTPSLNPIRWMSGFGDVFCGACTHTANGLP